jgi:hypothetical protein
MCVMLFSTNFVRKFMIIKRNERDNIVNVHRYPCKVTVFLVRLKLKVKFAYKFSNNTQISDLTKTRPVGAELLNAKGRTDEQT